MAAPAVLAPAAVRLTRSTAAFAIKHFESPELSEAHVEKVDHTEEFLIEEEILRVEEAIMIEKMNENGQVAPLIVGGESCELKQQDKDKLAPRKMEGEIVEKEQKQDKTELLRPPPVLRTGSSTSLLSVNSVVSTISSASEPRSDVSTVGSTPTISRRGSLILSKSTTATSTSTAPDEADVTITIDVENIDKALEKHLTLTTATPAPVVSKAAAPARARAHWEPPAPYKKDPWRASYPKPTEELDIAACLARPKLAGSPYERLQMTRAAMSPTARAAYDAKQALDLEARWKAHDKEMYEETIKNLTRPMGYASAFNAQEPIKRPQTYMNRVGFWEEFDMNQGGFRQVPGQAWGDRFAETPPPSAQVAEEQARRQADLERMAEE